MQLLQLLSAADPELRAEECKVHLASSNGIDDPLDVYLEGKFDEWQEWQSKRNFERPRIVSLIQIASANNRGIGGVLWSDCCGTGRTSSSWVIGRFLPGGVARSGRPRGFTR
ncbi:MAG: hypothetical protein U1F60_03625 [Planctomycetota bacterium]